MASRPSVSGVMINPMGKRFVSEGFADSTILAVDSSLIHAKNKLINGERVKTVKDFVKKRFELESKIKLEYFEIVETSSLKNVSEVDQDSDISLCIAGYLGNVRLIDNLSLN